MARKKKEKKKILTPSSLNNTDNKKAIAFCNLFILLFLIGGFTGMMGYLFYPYISLLGATGIFNFFFTTKSDIYSGCPTISEGYFQVWNQSIFSSKKPKNIKYFHIDKEHKIPLHSEEETNRIKDAIFFDVIEATLLSCDEEWLQKLDIIQKWKETHESLDSDILEKLYEENIHFYLNESTSLKISKGKKTNEEKEKDRENFLKAYNLFKSTKNNESFTLLDLDKKYSKLIYSIDNGKMRGDNGYFEIGSRDGVFINPVIKKSSVDLSIFKKIFEELESFFKANPSIPLPMQIVIKIAVYMSAHPHGKGNYRLITFLCNEEFKKAGYPPIKLKRKNAESSILFADTFEGSDEFSNSRFLSKKYKNREFKNVHKAFKQKCNKRFKDALFDITNKIIESIENYSTLEKQNRKVFST